jgi:glyoxylase-like metal-dependent hydrolase (beta-lactamase superfamily II)
MRASGLSCVATLALAVAGTLVGQEMPDWSKIEIKAERVAGSVHMLYGVGGFAGGNIGVSVGDDGVLLVDDQFEPLVPKIQAALRGLTEKPVRFVLSTHYHGDHTHGNKVFGTTSTIIAHDNVRRRMATDDYFDGKQGTRAPSHALPVLTFDRELSVHVNGEEIRGIHSPAGHTDGDVVVHFTGSKVVHMGDLYFNGMYPFIDLEGGGNVKGYVAAVEKVHDALPADVKVIPGHGPLATKADLQGYLTMLKETVAAVEQGLREGQTLEQLQKAKPTAKHDARWGGGFLKPETYVAQLHNSLKGIAKNPQ